MKVDATKTAHQVQTPKQPFAQVLKQAKPVAAKAVTPATPKLATPAKAVGSPRVGAPPARTVASQVQHAGAPVKQLAQVRAHVDAEAKRLATVRSDHSHAANSMTQVRTERSEQLDEKQNAKLADALTQEFAKEPQPVLPAPKLENVQPGNAPVKIEAPAETKAAQASALIEKIEHFVRSNRPGLSLTLHHSLGARVELERLGPKELSVKLFGKPSAEAVGKIREELRARGLNVKLNVV